MTEQAATPRNWSEKASAVWANAARYTDPRVHPRIRELVNHHYNQGGGPAKLRCVGGAQTNCEC